MKRNFFTSLRAVTMMALLLLVLIGVSGCRDDQIKTQSITITSADDLPGARIGVQLGTTGDLYASDYEAEGAEIQRFTKSADAIQALKQDKLDCIVIDASPAQAFVANNADLMILDEAFSVEEYAICIAKENSDLKEAIDVALTQMKNDGTLDRIISNYIGDETKGFYPYQSSEEIVRDQGILVAATNATFEPYEYMENNEVVGIDVDIAQAICDILGMELRIENIEFDAIINSVQSGKSDIGIAGMTVTEERLKNIDFTQSYTTATQVIVVKSGMDEEAATILDKLHDNFIKENRWEYIVVGLLTTLKISFFALVIGLVLGFLIAGIRTTCDRTGKVKWINGILKLYLTIIRGTPAMIQLLIIYYVVFAAVDVNKVLVAIIAFGLNSSAYIAEIVRGGIESVDIGQFEAGRSLGFSYTATMRYFILPQAFKNVLPSLGNEFIMLLKETSISGYIGIMDLTRGGDYIRSRTYEAFLPLITVAVVYLSLVVLLSSIVGKMERRLKKDVRI